MMKLCGVHLIQYFIEIIILTSVVQQSLATCYFSPELQGIYVMQSAVTHDHNVLYSQVNVTEDAIPIWGECYERIDNNIILRIGSEETSCFRCFHLKLLSRNVLRVLVADKDYISKCYTNEAVAIASCPTSDSNSRDSSSRNQEIILYKIYESSGEEIRREYCPFSERYHFTYSVEDDASAVGPMECLGKESELDSCPSGSSMNLRFRECTFDNREITFECLGQWQGLGQKNYMALVSAKSNGNFGPKYRCATFFENPNTGIITISLSSDSTCSSIDSYSRTNQANLPSQRRNEILHLYPSERHSWQTHQDYCQFPDWLHGRWEYVTIGHDEITYRDHSSFKTYKMKCLKQESDATAISGKNVTESKFLVFSRTQCGEEQYHCIWMTKRSTKIMEFQIGAKTVQSLANDGDDDFSYSSICDAQYFDDSRWITQGRLDRGLPTTPCPVDGELEGFIPDAEGLCAKLWSECHTPDVMYYQVSACGYNEVFEEREYQCLGQWQENDVVYIYTKRRDVGTHECFVGSIKGDEYFLKEASEHCQRDIDPNRYGMQLKQTKFCNGNHRVALNKHHPVIGHMNPVLDTMNRPTSMPPHNFDPIPAFSPLPPIDRTHELSTQREMATEESTTLKRLEASPATSSTTMTSTTRVTTEHSHHHQYDDDEKLMANDVNETIQFVVHNDTSSLPKDEQQEYVVSAVVTNAAKSEITKNKSPPISAIRESDFNSAHRTFHVSLAVLIAAIILTNRHNMS